MVGGCEDGRLCFPFFEFVYLKNISMVTRPTSELTLGLSIRGMNRRIEAAKILL